jgi:hypothetical protein
VGVVAIAEGRLHGVVADRLEVGQFDIALARLQHFLARAVALHLGRGRVDAHQLEGNAEGRAVREAHLEHARLAVHGDRLRRRCARFQACHSGIPFGKILGGAQYAARLRLHAHRCANTSA